MWGILLSSSEYVYLEKGDEYRNIQEYRLSKRLEKAIGRRKKSNVGFPTTERRGLS